MHIQLSISLIILTDTSPVRHWYEVCPSSIDFSFQHKRWRGADNRSIYVIPNNSLLRTPAHLSSPPKMKIQTNYKIHSHPFHFHVLGKIQLRFFFFPCSFFVLPNAGVDPSPYVKNHLKGTTFVMRHRYLGMRAFLPFARAMQVNINHYFTLHSNSW